MHAFDVLGDPVRRRLLELLADGEQSAGDLASSIHEQFGISQPAVSQHLKVLRDNGFATVRAAGPRRLYAVQAAPMQQVDAWLDRYRPLYEQRLDALATELARGRARPPDSTRAGPERSTPLARPNADAPQADTPHPVTPPTKETP